MQAIVSKSRLCTLLSCSPQGHVSPTSPLFNIDSFLHTRARHSRPTPNTTGRDDRESQVGIRIPHPSSHCGSPRSHLLYSTLCLVRDASTAPCAVHTTSRPPRRSCWVEQKMAEPRRMGHTRLRSDGWCCRLGRLRGSAQASFGRGGATSGSLER